MVDQTLNDLANGIYEQWVNLDLINEIKPEEWKQEIENRLRDVR